MHELKAMKTDMKEVEAKHEKQVEVIHESYKRMISLQPAEDKSKADAMRVAMDGKVDNKAIKGFSGKEIENSVYKFEEDLKLMGLLDVAEGDRAGSIEEEKRLKRAILRGVCGESAQRKRARISKSMSAAWG